jgi:predicted phage terminase large subunit-like protein
LTLTERFTTWDFWREALATNADSLSIFSSRLLRRYPTLRNMAIALAEAYKPEVILVEDATTGISLVQELKQMGDYNVRAIKIEQDKLGRLYVHQAKFEAGLVHFPSEATWLRELETELLTFPQAKYDDQVDSISQALAYKAEYDSTMAWAEHLVGLLPDYAKIGWMYR